MAEWDYLTSLEKQWSCFEFVSAISNVAKHISTGRASRKFPREAWDMILLAFGPSRDQPQKRSSSNTGGTAGGSTTRDSLTCVTATFGRLREVTALTVSISMLARLHNVLRDDSSLELYAEYLNPWPATIPKWVCFKQFIVLRIVMIFRLLRIGCFVCALKSLERYMFCILTLIGYVVIDKGYVIVFFLTFIYIHRILCMICE